MARQRSPGRVVGAPVALLLILAGVAAIATIALIAAGESGFAVAPGIFVVLLLAAAVVDVMLSQRKVRSHGQNVEAVESDSEDAVPAIVQPEGEPLGASSEVHTDLNRHDLPLDHPGRPKVEGAEEAAADAAGKPRRDQAGFERGG